MSDYLTRRCLICARINPCRDHSADAQLSELKRNDREIERITGKNPNERLPVY